MFTFETERCVKGQTDAPNDKSLPDTQRYQRELGGVAASQPPWPIYFLDEEYRRRKHKVLEELVKEDDMQRQKRLGLKPHDIEIEKLLEEARESRRRFWAKEAQAEALKRAHAMTEK